MDTDNNMSEEKTKGFHWANQSKLMIQQIENIMKEMLPCPTNKLIAECEYRTGLSNNKVCGIISIFRNREVVTIKLTDYKGRKEKCMVFSDG